MAFDDSELDGALARRIASGSDASAEQELCRRMFPRIRAYAWRRLHNQQDALDFAQQVLMTVIQALRTQQVNEPERIAAFVMGTCRNALLDQRKHERRRTLLLEQFLATFRDVQPPLEPLDTDRLETCLEQLPMRERLIVVATYLEEQGSSEIAEKVGMQAGNVRVTRHRALKQLLSCMEARAR